MIRALRFQMLCSINMAVYSETEINTELAAWCFDPNLWDDSDRTDLHGTFTGGVSRAKEQFINFAGIAVYRPHSVGFHYETYMYGEISLTLSPFRFTAQFNFAVSDRYSYEKMHTASLSTARLG